MENYVMQAVHLLFTGNPLNVWGIESSVEDVNGVDVL